MRATRRTELCVIGTLLVIGLIASCIAPAAAKTGPTSPDQPYRLYLFHTNDAESKLINAGQGLEDFGGAARFATLLRELRDEAWASDPPGGLRAGAITVSSGDNFLAGPEFSASLEHGVPYYDSIALRRMGFDAMAIGNHEFDFGPDVLHGFLQGFAENPGDLFDRPVFVSANLDFSGEPDLQELVDAGVIRKSVVIRHRNAKIGIVGATTPRLSYISSPRFVTVDQDVRARVQEEIDALQQSGVNKIIFISHLQSILEDVALIEELRGLDIAVAGGGSELLANPDDVLVPGDESLVYAEYPLIAHDADGREIPVVTTFGEYRYVGRLVVDFNASGEIVAIGDESGPVRVAGGAQPDAVPADPFVQTEVVDPVSAYIADLAAQVVAQTEVPLDGLRPQVRTVETNEGNLIADAMLWQATQLAPEFGVPLPQIGLQNGGGIRNNSILPVGPITALNTFQMLPFANFVCVIPDIPADQFNEILENAVSRVEFTDGRFAQVAGFRFTWDPAGTAQVLDSEGQVVTEGTRVREVVLDDQTVLVQDGAVVDGAPSVNIATIDFLARGGDQYPYRDAEFFTLGVTYQQALAAYLQAGLGGTVTEAQYPFGGEGRITRLSMSVPAGAGTAAGLAEGHRDFSIRRQGGTARIGYALSRAGHVSLSLYDLTGRRVATLFEGDLPAGAHETNWDGRDESGSLVPSGVYFARLASEDGIRHRKLVFLH